MTIEQKRSLAIINEHLEDQGASTWSEYNAKDLGLTGQESEAELYEIAREIASEEATEKAYFKNAWRFEI